MVLFNLHVRDLHVRAIDNSKAVVLHFPHPISADENRNQQNTILRNEIQKLVKYL